MQRDVQLLLDMLESAKLAIRYVSQKSKTDFLSDIQLQDAVIRRLAIIGEAARRISEITRQTYPKIPWSNINGMRNRLIHEYDDLDLDIVWDTVLTSLPLLIEEI
ncbi:DUF86 domain-containing protein [Chroococcus sp. FPU101]|uniref:HepT-like ribonuclease domain-containing protein n=1 Tax=Chroococcus sp. FPU101 TaxID=1974212 RepID=UPI001A8EFF61|nr:DUF86 domain-containing protein [Chroococcus sp. FPU101]GFE67485.1 protein of unknown function DUF86 [Chroococcus sp. FPU101]